MFRKLSISSRKKFGFTIVDISGDITFDDSVIIEETIKEASADPGLTKKTIVLNLAEVPFINSSALSTLLKISVTLRAKGIEFYLMNVSDTIKGLMEMTRVKGNFLFLKNESDISERIKKDDMDSILEI